MFALLIWISGHAALRESDVEQGINIMIYDVVEL